MITDAKKTMVFFASVLFLSLSIPAEPTYRRVIERVTSLDPIEGSSVYAARAVSLCYETLLEYDYKARPYKLKPCLATSMPTVSSNGLVYTFTIDTNATFIADECFNGIERHVTAHDFVYSLKRLADARLSSSGYWLLDGRVAGINEFHNWTLDSSKISKFQSFNGTGTGSDKTHTSNTYPEVRGLRAVSDEILEIELIAPSPVFLWMLAMPYTAAVPYEAVEYYGTKFKEHPVGTGPYILENWQRNYKMTYRRNTLWRGWKTAGTGLDQEDSGFRFQVSGTSSNPQPSASNVERQTPNTEHNSALCTPHSALQGSVPYEKIVFPLIDDPSTQWLCFLAGELDLQGEIARDNWDQVIMADGSLNPELAQKGVVLHTMPTLEVAYIGLNMDDPILGKNKKLRQALNAAFDAAAWEKYYRGRVVRSEGPVPLHVAGAITNSLPYGRGLETAKKLLAEAGYPEGRDKITGRQLRLTLDLGKNTPDMRESTELIIAFMDRCGIELVPEYSNWPSFLKKVSERRAQMFRVAWVGDYPDAENFLQLFYGPNASPGPNRCNYSNPEFDRRYLEAMSTTDEAKRIEIYGELQKIIQEDSPWIFMNFAKAASLSHANLINYMPHDFSYGMEKHLRFANAE